MKMFWAIALCLLCAVPGEVAQAQTTDLYTPAQIASRIRSVSPKTVCFVFDVSGSTKSGGVFARERAASATIIRQGCEPGDRVAMYAFGTGFQTVFDQVLTTHADADALVDLLPGNVAPGQGTNIRWPHAQALETVQSHLPVPGVIVLLTDSFNDRPVTSDPNYPKYLAYYSLHGLTIYPNTPENRAYERLLRTLKKSGKLSQYGVGVGLAPSGRPIERLPLRAGMDTQSASGGDLQPVVLAPTGSEKPVSSPIVPIGAGVLVVLIAALLFYWRSRPIPLRLRLGDKSAPRDYQMRPGQTVQLGGTTNPNGEAFPLAGTSSVQATISVVRGALMLSPASETVEVFHNGSRLREPVLLKTGDEVRVSLPATENASSREHHLRIEDPHGASF